MEDNNLFDEKEVSEANNEVSIEEFEEKKEKKGGWKKELFEWVQAIVIAVVVAFVLKNYVLTLVKVQGESMEPTLQNADRIYVNRFMYEPKKGDIVIFRPESDPKRPYVKRIIATEGDTLYIDFELGEVYLNGELLDEPYILEPTHRYDSYITSLIEQGNYSKDNPIVIEEGKVFVMGDNRNNSEDSRALGQIPVEDIMGHACFRFWPLDNFETF